MRFGMSPLLLILAFLIVSPVAHGYGEASDPRKPDARECEDGLLSHFQTRLLTDDIFSLREPVARQIQGLPYSPEADFWLNTLFLLKQEQAGFSTVYFLPQGDQSLTRDEQERLFAAHPEEKFNRPANENEWRQFYWNHLQGQIRFVATQFKRVYVRSLDPDFDLKKADRAFDAVIMPTVIEDCGLDEARIRQEIALVTKESLHSNETQRRMSIKSLGPKACCKTPGGCYDCFHNRRHLKCRGE